MKLRKREPQPKAIDVLGVPEQPVEQRLFDLKRDMEPGDIQGILDTMDRFHHKQGKALGYGAALRFATMFVPDRVEARHKDEQQWQNMVRRLRQLHEADKRDAVIHHIFNMHQCFPERREELRALLSEKIMDERTIPNISIHMDVLDYPIAMEESAEIRIAMPDYVSALHADIIQGVWKYGAERLQNHTRGKDANFAYSDLAFAMHFVFPERQEELKEVLDWEAMHAELKKARETVKDHGTARLIQTACNMNILAADRVVLSGDGDIIIKNEPRKMGAALPLPERPAV
ncbi:MAG: hypothetical protein ABIG66_02685 [Candidatus Kerfeldbacteria bacterium]